MINGLPNQLSQIEVISRAAMDGWLHCTTIETLDMLKSWLRSRITRPIRNSAVNSGGIGYTKY